MKFKIHLLVSILFAFSLTGCKKSKHSIVSHSKLDNNKDYIVVILAGQSNMIGFGNPKHISDFEFPENIVYFNFSFDTNLKPFINNFGPEIGIANVLHTKFPDQNFILLKYAVGGSSLIDWSPIQNNYPANTFNYSNLYDKMIAEIHKITDNYKTSIKAFVWMQGETDASQLSLAKNYESNFKQLITSLRIDLNYPQLPIIYGRINPPHQDYIGTEDVRKAQENFSAVENHCYFIDTDGLPKLKDQLHLNSEALLLLGKNFGIKVSEVLQ
jgi:hypothetical protein